MFTPGQCLFAILLNCESKFYRLVQSGPLGWKKVLLVYGRKPKFQKWVTSFPERPRQSLALKKVTLQGPRQSSCPLGTSLVVATMDFLRDKWSKRGRARGRSFSVLVTPFSLFALHLAVLWELLLPVGWAAFLQGAWIARLQQLYCLLGSHRKQAWTGVLC